MKKLTMKINTILFTLLLILPMQSSIVAEEQKASRTLKQTWSKVIKLRWRSLDKEDAWNMLQTTIAVGCVVGATYGTYQGIKYMQKDYELIVPDLIYTPSNEYNRYGYGLQKREEVQIITIPTEELNQPINNDSIECTLMGDNCEEEFLPTLRYKLGCEHLVACGNCLRAHIRAHVSEGNSGNIPCPQQNCNHIITPQEIRNSAVDTDKDRDLISCANRAIVTQQFMGAVRARNDARICHKCNAIFIYRGRKVIHCPSCDAEYCAHCRADRTQCNGRVWVCATKRATVAKKCPRCGCVILKNRGCNHMTCGQCNYGFCWICLGNRCGHFRCVQFRIRW